jgi:tetratricopeptide (TPR) repeat protein
MDSTSVTWAAVGLLAAILFFAAYWLWNRRIVRAPERYQARLDKAKQLASLGKLKAALRAYRSIAQGILRVERKDGVLSRALTNLLGEASLGAGLAEEQRKRPVQALEFFRAACARIEVENRVLALVAHDFASRAIVTALSLDVFVQYVKATASTRSANDLVVKFVESRLRNSTDAAWSIEIGLRLTNADPGLEWAHYLVGLAYSGTRRFQLALDFFQAAERINPTASDYPYELGIAYEALERFRDASDAQRRCLAISPDRHQALYHLATWASPEKVET